MTRENTYWTLFCPYGVAFFVGAKRVSNHLRGSEDLFKLRENCMQVNFCSKIGIGVVRRLFCIITPPRVTKIVTFYEII